MRQMERERQNIHNSRRVLASQVYHSYSKPFTANSCEESLEIMKSSNDTATKFSQELQKKEAEFQKKYGFSA